MFLFSEMGKKKDFKAEYRIIRESPFEVLALCDMAIPKKTCTFLEDEKYIPFLKDNISMVITTGQIAAKLELKQEGIIVTEHPRILFFQIHNFLADDEKYKRKENKNFISNKANISEMAWIAGHDVRIEENVLIEPFVTIYPHVHIGKNTVIRSGARIGGEGFEFKRFAEKIIPVKHLGGVEIGSDVEIQNNSCIDKAVYPWDNTVIGDDTKVDNLVYIAHGVKVEPNVLIAGSSGIGGRTVIGRDTWIGLGSEVRNGLNIGKSARINMGAVVTKPVMDGQSVSGNFAVEHHEFLKFMKIQR